MLTTLTVIRMSFGKTGKDAEDPPLRPNEIESRYNRPIRRQNDKIGEFETTEHIGNEKQ